MRRERQADSEHKHMEKQDEESIARHSTCESSDTLSNL